MNPLRRPRREFWAAQAENLRIALDALRANKMRSVLTVVGNVVAVMSVIAVVAVIDGMNTYVSEKVLEQGLKAFHASSIHLPRRAEDHLSPAFLEERMERFESAA